MLVRIEPLKSFIAARSLLRFYRHDNYSDAAGAEAAVLVPVQEWRRLQACARPSLKQLLLADIGRGDLVLPTRGRAKRRNVEPLL